MLSSPGTTGGRSTFGEGRGGEEVTPGIEMGAVHSFGAHEVNETQEMMMVIRIPTSGKMGRLHAKME